MDNDLEVHGPETPTVTAQSRTVHPWAALAAMLAGTFLGTVSNSIVNVPLRRIADDLDAPLSSAVLVVISFLLTFAVAMPLMGWLGDRLGRRRVLCCALVGLAIGALAAATATNMTALIACRVVQGLATAAVLPTVMGLIADIFGPDRRARALGFWAAVNGIGQALGPPVGGLLSDGLGWRWIFVPLAPAALVTLAATLWLVPRDRGRSVSLDVLGAATLTLGSALVIAAATAIPLDGVRWIVPAALVTCGVALLVLFGWLAGRSARPFIARPLILESRFLRSSLAAFTQMFCLGATLVAVPLYLTGAGGNSTALTGLVVFALPAAMTVVAPVAGFLTERLGPRWVIRSGLLTLALAQTGLGLLLRAGHDDLASVAAVLLASGVGIALVQAPAATGATRSPAGAVGAALGLFNLIRFAGSAIGAAWVAIVLPHDDLLVLFGGCAVMALAGLAGTYAGPDPLPMGARQMETAARSSA